MYKRTMRIYRAIFISEAKRGGLFAGGWLLDRRFELILITLWLMRERAEAWTFIGDLSTGRRRRLGLAARNDAEKAVAVVPT